MRHIAVRKSLRTNEFSGIHSSLPFQFEAIECGMGVGFDGVEEGGD